VRVIAIEPLPFAASCVDAVQERYSMTFFGTKDGADDFTEAWRRVAAAPSLPWRREGKKSGRDLDARAFFIDITHAMPGSCELLIDWSGGYVSPLALCLHALSAVGHVNAPELVRLTRLA
jgi:hypothetical protein